MGAVTHIQWTDHTFNPWEGCTKVSPGCLHCYAETRNQRFTGGANWGKGKPRRRTSVHNWNEPLRWNRQAETNNLGRSSVRIKAETQHGAHDASAPLHYRPRVFCASLADWLDDEVPLEWLADLLELISKTRNLDWQLLTKRPENWKDRLASAWTCVMTHGPATDDRYIAAKWVENWLNGRPPANVWVGTSVEDQTRADLRIPLLFKIPARIRFLSCEPLLEAVNIPAAVYSAGRLAMDEGWGIHWVICGGESGHGARSMNLSWARGLRDQCLAAGVPFFFKQWGEHDFRTIRVGKIAAGRYLDDKLHDEFPSFNSTP